MGGADENLTNKIMETVDPSKQKVKKGYWVLFQQVFDLKILFERVEGTVRVAH